MSKAGLVELGHEQLVASPYNKRRWRADDGLDPKLMDLARNIAAHGGNFEPIIVRPIVFAGQGGVTHEIVAGECRVRAVRLLHTHKELKKLGKPKVLAMVRELTDEEAFAITMDENRRRQNLSPLEEADTLAAYMEANPKWSVDQAAAQLGVSRSVAVRRLQLRKLSSRWQAVMVEGGHPASGWSASHFERIAALPVETQDAFLDSIDVEDDWQVKETHAMSLEDLRFALCDHFQLLDGVPWKLEDATLGAPPCLGCTKRSGAFPELFDEQDFAPGNTAKKPGERCLDGACFVFKRDAFVERRRVELEQRVGPLVLVSARGITPEAKAAGVRSAYDFQAVTKATPGAVPVLRVGEGATGKVEYMKPYHALSSSERKPEPMELRRAKLEQKRFQAVARAIVEWIDGRVAARDMSAFAGPMSCRKISPLALLKVIPARGTGHVPIDFAERLEEENKKSAEVLLEELALWSVAELRQKYQSLTQKGEQVAKVRLTEFCRVFGLDFEVLWYEACEAHPEPASWAGLGEDGQPKGVNAFTKPKVPGKAKAGTVPGTFTKGASKAKKKGAVA